MVKAYTAFNELKFSFAPLACASNRKIRFRTRAMRQSYYKFPVVMVRRLSFMALASSASLPKSQLLAIKDRRQATLQAGGDKLRTKYGRIRSIMDGTGDQTQVQ